MQRLCFYIITAITLLCVACNNNNKKDGKPYGEALQQPGDILSDPGTFADYYYSLKLSRDFIALDTNDAVINKAAFLQRLIAGSYLPIELEANDSNLYYKLYPVPGNTNDVGSIQQLAQTEYTHYQMEGKPVPGFNYTDINGVAYNPQTTKAKIVVLKCWFIHCQKCNEEIPELNKLVDRYKNRQDVVFLALAFDTPNELRTFLTKKPFNYAHASVKEEYFLQQLRVNEFPTHIVVNKQGLIVKMVSDAEEMEMVLNKEALQ